MTGVSIQIHTQIKLMFSRAQRPTKGEEATDYTTFVVVPVILFPAFPPPEWTFMCLVNWSPLPKHLPQPGSGQAYGRAPVCVRSWSTVRNCW